MLLLVPFGASDLHCEKKHSGLQNETLGAGLPQLTYHLEQGHPG